MCKKFLSIMIITLVCSTNLLQASEPPGFKEMLNKINLLWKQKQFDKVDVYVNHLMSDYSNYLPVIIVDAIHSVNRGAQDEAIVRKMTALLEEVQKFPADIPPFCTYEIKRTISTHTESVKDYNKLGWSKEWRLKRFNPRNPNLTLFNWSFSHDFLFLSCPPLTFPTGSSQSVIKHRPLKVDSKTLSLSVKGLKQRIQDKQNSILERAVAIKAFNQKANEDEIIYLIECLSFNSFQLVTVCAAAISENNYAKSLAPILLKMVANIKSSKSVVQLAIWSLIRMGNKIPETLPTLKKLTEKRFFWNSEIKEAINYLERKK